MNKIHGKTLARLAAVQFLYTSVINNKVESDITQAKKLAKLYKDKHIENLEHSEMHYGYYKKLVSAIDDYRSFAETLLDKHLKDRSIEDNHILIRAILIAAVCESSIIKDVPRKVIINEYTNIASSFYDKSQVGFINAILDEVII